MTLDDLKTLLRNNYVFNHGIEYIWFTETSLQYGVKKSHNYFKIKEITRGKGYLKIALIYFQKYSTYKGKQAPDKFILDKLGKNFENKFSLKLHKLFREYPLPGLE